MSVVFVLGRGEAYETSREELSRGKSKLKAWEKRLRRYNNVYTSTPRVLEER